MVDSVTVSNNLASPFQHFQCWNSNMPDYPIGVTCKLKPTATIKYSQSRPR